jgi:hypothetical protein
MQVAIASLAFFSTAVAAHGENAAVAAAAWPPAWAALRTIATALADPATPCHASVRVRFVQTIAPVYSHAKSRFVATGAYRELLDDLSALCSCPVSSTETWPPYFIPPVQAAALAALPALLPPAAAEWPALVRFLCTQLAPPVAAVEVSTAALGAPDAAAHECAIRRLWTRDVSTAALGIFQEEMPQEARVESLEPLLAALRPGIDARWSALEAEECACALMCDCCALVDTGLPAAHRAAAPQHGGPDSEARLWITLAHTLRACIHAPQPCGAPGSAHVMSGPAARDAPPSPNHDTEASGDDAESRVLDCLTDTVLASASAARSAVERDLIAILDDACAGPDGMHATPGTRLAQVALRKLFVLCGVGERRSGSPEKVAVGGAAHGARAAQHRIAVLALPVFLRRCRAILGAYAQSRASSCDGHSMTSRTASAATTPAASVLGTPGRAPVATGLRDLASGALQALATLRVARSVAEAALPAADWVLEIARPDEGTPDSAGASGRGHDAMCQAHLPAVHGSVVECARVGDGGIRDDAARVLAAMGNMLGLDALLPSL